MNRLELSAGVVLLLASIAINAFGAADRNTALWNVRPQDIDLHPERNWDWRQPQFLAGFLRPPVPDVIPPLQTRSMQQNPILIDSFGTGGSPPEAQFRWSDGYEAALVFAMQNHKTRH